MSCTRTFVSTWHTVQQCHTSSRMAWLSRVLNLPSNNGLGGDTGNTKPSCHVLQSYHSLLYPSLTYIILLLMLRVIASLVNIQRPQNRQQEKSYVVFSLRVKYWQLIARTSLYATCSLHNMLYDAICISEIWLNINITDRPLLNNSKYVIIWCDQVNGGRVAMHERIKTQVSCICGFIQFIICTCWNCVRWFNWS